MYSTDARSTGGGSMTRLTPNSPDGVCELSKLISTSLSHCLQTFPQDNPPGSRPRLTSAMLTRYLDGSVPPLLLGSLGRQISPGKNMIFPYTTAAFTLPPKPRASSCGADLPGGWALYAISVRRLIVLYSGFLQTSLMRSPLPSTSIYVSVSQQ